MRLQSVFEEHSFPFASHFYFILCRRRDVRWKLERKIKFMSEKLLIPT